MASRLVRPFAEKEPQHYPRLGRAFYLPRRHSVATLYSDSVQTYNVAHTETQPIWEECTHISVHRICLLILTCLAADVFHFYIKRYLLYYSSSHRSKYFSYASQANTSWFLHQSLAEQLSLLES